MAVVLAVVVAADGRDFGGGGGGGTAAPVEVVAILTVSVIQAADMVLPVCGPGSALLLVPVRRQHVNKTTYDAGPGPWSLLVLVLLACFLRPTKMRTPGPAGTRGTPSSFFLAEKKKKRDFSHFCFLS